jgi:adenylosuccinate synthase
VQAYVVIGACFGDEGKGLTTDFLAAKHAGKALIVRFNGGAQAGHTVETPDGVRHVFKHFGSGALVGSPTFLSEFFICNPLLFNSECTQLQNYAVQPRTFVHAKAIVTTPFDMMINQIVEEHRAGGRHGSCGVGIGETVERSLHAQFLIHAQDLADAAALRQKLIAIQTQWVPVRLKALGIHDISAVWQERINAAGVLDYFLQQSQQFLGACTLTDNSILQQFNTVIFEGAQGLLLDQDHEFFPHVTRSYTGLNNVLEIANDVGIKSLQVFYAARAYLTRHGAGPLPHELPAAPYAKIVDKTNVNNMYQGSLRFAWFNFDLLQAALQKDLMQAQHIQVIPNLLISCLDQLDEEIKFVKNNTVHALASEYFLAHVQAHFPDFKIWGCHGPQRTAISELSKEFNLITA